MNCELARELAALAGSGDVTAVERRELDAHTAGCAACLAESGAFEALCGQLGSMREMTVAESVYSAVRARVLAEVGERRRSGWLAAWPAFVAVLACSLVLVVLLRPVAPVVTQPAVAAVANVPAPAPVPEPAPPVREIHRPVARVKAEVSGEPVVVRLLTNDPDVVIYWIADGKRRGSEREIIQ